MVADVGADLKKQADRELAHVVGAVDRDVQDRDAFFLRVLIIHDIVAGGKDSDSLQVRARVDGCLADRGLVDDCDLCVSKALCDDRVIHIGSAVVNGYFAKGLKGSPADISGILGVSVKHNDLHGYFSFCAVKMSILMYQQRRRVSISGTGFQLTGLSL